jgi:glycosyltransferase involved in cell wall biosynthesis
VSDSGAPQEIVGDAGLIFNYGSHHDLADKIIMLLQDGDLRQELGIKAYKKIVKNFTWEKAARNYLDIYKKVLN